MNGIPATIRNGRVELAQPLNLPDGTLVEVVPLGNGQTSHEKLKAWPPGFFDELRKDWGGEAFERPPQGEYEVREDW